MTRKLLGTDHATRTVSARTLRQPSRSGLLLILLGAVFMTTADNSIVNVAVPSIADDLHASGGQLELVVSGYVLAYAVLLVTGARLGGLYGYRRMFLLGVAAFTVASLACALALNPIWLIVARIAQGLGAAAMVPQVLTGIQTSFEGAARTRALGYYPVALAGGAAAGQVLGGALVTLNLFGVAWRSVFLVNVPVGVAVFLVGAVRLPVDNDPNGGRLDLKGVAALSATISLLVVPLMLGRDYGWPPWAWIALAASIPALWLFVAIERGVASRGALPVLQLGLFRSRRIAWGLAAQAGATVTYAALLFVLAIYLQDGLGKSAFYAGAALISWVVGFGVSGPLLRKLPAHFGPAIAPAAFGLLGCALLGVALEGLTLTPQGAALAALLGIAGFGMGAGFSALVTHLMAAVDRELTSDLSGVLSTNSEVAGALGVAVFGTLYLALAADGGTRTSVAALTLVVASLGALAVLAAVAASRALTTSPDAP
jgi:MFS family permease